jgi:hypothetical protein
LVKNGKEKKELVLVLLYQIIEFNIHPPQLYIVISYWNRFVYFIILLFYFLIFSPSRTLSFDFSWTSEIILKYSLHRMMFPTKQFPRDFLSCERRGDIRAHTNHQETIRYPTIYWEDDSVNSVHIGLPNWQTVLF